MNVVQFFKTFSFTFEWFIEVSNIDDIIISTDFFSNKLRKNTTLKYGF